MASSFPTAKRFATRFKLPGMEPLTIRLFGPMLVLVGETPMPRLRSRKALWLLALLTLRGNRPVAREWLATTLWPDVDLTAAFANLRPVMSELRRALGEHGERVQSIDRNTVRFDVDEADVDVHRFDLAIRKQDFATAAELYRGPLLEDCNEEWAPQERTVRENDCLRALQALGEAALEVHAYDRAASLFDRAIAIDGWRDAPRRGLMQALAAQGDVNAALHTYRDFANLLSAEAATSPDAATTELYNRLRAAAKRGTPTTRSESKPSSEAGKPTGSLPHPVSPIVGREDERIELTQRLRNSRLVTLVGSGGIGKTRLATEVARGIVGEFPDGVWMVSLEGCSQLREVPKEVSRMVGLAETSGRTPTEMLVTAWRDRRVLLLLDNCEHLIDACAELAGTLLRDCGDVRVLATSREPLGITGERVWPVPPLATPSPEGLPEGKSTLIRVMLGYESVQLFLERAQAANPSFEITAENAHAVAEICARLEGTPLAIELAAARLRAMTAQQIAERLGDSLRLLVGTRGAASKRQQTLRATLDWSHDMLRPETQRLMRRLAVFANGWTLDAAEAVSDLDASEYLESLVDKSLVVFDEATGRYRYLETVRQYAVERFKASDERTDVEAKFRRWAIDLATRSEQGFYGPEQSEWARRLDAESDNLRAALRMCAESPEEGLALAGPLTRYWYFRNRYSEGLEACQTALDRLGADMPTEPRAKALNGAGTFAYALGDIPLATRRWEECLALRRTLGDPRGLAIAIGNVASLTYYSRQFSEGARLYEESLALYREIGDRRGIAMALSNLATMRKKLGQFTLAKRDVQESLGLFREMGDERMSCWLLKELGDVELVQSRFGEARAAFEEALAGFRESKDATGEGWTLDALSVTLFELGLVENAATLREEARVLFTEAKSKTGLASVAIHAGQAALRRGHLMEARALLERCVADEEDPHRDGYRVEALLALGDVEKAEDRIGPAEQRYREALRFASECESAYEIAQAFERLATVMPEEVQPRLLRAAHRLRLELGVPTKETASHFGKTQEKGDDWKSLVPLFLKASVL